MFCVIIITIIIVENSKLTKTRYLERPIKMGMTTITRMNLTKSIQSRIDKIISNRQKSLNLKNDHVHTMLTLLNLF